MQRFPLTVMLALLGSFMILVGGVCMPAKKNADPRLDKLTLPQGFHISIYADGVKNARQMALAPDGTIFVGTRNEGNVYAVRDFNGDYQADTVLTLAQGLHMPNGVAFRDGDLYVAEVSRVWKWKDILKHLDQPGAPEVIHDSLPNEDHHGWKYIAFGPDGKLYVPVGAPCNICESPQDPRFATILRMNPDGTETEVYAAGVRNSVGFAWHPSTKALWFTDNGRDWLGDDSPGDELNCAPIGGMHFGYPYFHADGISDPKYGEGKSSKEFANPKQVLGAHVAALGILFYQGQMFPPEYRNRLLICEHGSWNRSTPSGYRVSMVDIDPEGQNASNYTGFVEGWLSDGKAWGRPVAMLELPDGSVLVSDDLAGMIYRITYEK